jgi:hypothetical protein
MTLDFLAAPSVGQDSLKVGTHNGTPRLRSAAMGVCALLAGLLAGSAALVCGLFAYAAVLSSDHLVEEAETPKIGPFYQGGPARRTVNPAAVAPAPLETAAPSATGRVVIAGPGLGLAYLPADESGPAPAPAQEKLSYAPPPVVDEAPAARSGKLRCRTFRTFNPATETYIDFQGRTRTCKG